LAQSRKHCIEIAFSAGIQDMKLHAECASGCLQASRQRLGIGIGGVDEQSHDLGGGDCFMQQF
jgi:hypothetical protein